MNFMNTRNVPAPIANFIRNSKEGLSLEIGQLRHIMTLANTGLVSFALHGAVQGMPMAGQTEDAMAVEAVNGGGDEQGTPAFSGADECYTDMFMKGVSDHFRRCMDAMEKNQTYLITLTPLELAQAMDGEGAQMCPIKAQIITKAIEVLGVDRTINNGALVNINEIIGHLRAIIDPQVVTVNIGGGGVIPPRDNGAGGVGNERRSEGYAMSMSTPFPIMHRILNPTPSEVMIASTTPGITDVDRSKWGRIPHTINPNGEVVIETQIVKGGLTNTGQAITIQRMTERTMSEDLYETDELRAVNFAMLMMGPRVTNDNGIASISNDTMFKITFVQSFPFGGFDARPVLSRNLYNEADAIAQGKYSFGGTTFVVTIEHEGLTLVAPTQACHKQLHRMLKRSDALDSWTVLVANSRYLTNKYWLLTSAPANPGWFIYNLQAWVTHLAPAFLTSHGNHFCSDHNLGGDCAWAFTTKEHQPETDWWQLVF